MQITIDTSLPLNDTERQMLSVLMGTEFVLGEVAQTESKFVQPVEPEVVPVKKAVAKKAVAKPAPVVEEEPEPMAEEPLEDEVEDDVLGEEQSDEELLALAVKKATEMVAGGQAAVVREALDAAGASRVRELNKDNVRAFFQALP